MKGSGTYSSGTASVVNWYMAGGTTITSSTSYLFVVGCSWLFIRYLGIGNGSAS